MTRALLLFLALCALSAEGGNDGLLIRGALMIDGTGAAPRPDTDILIRGGRIAAIETSGSLAFHGREIDAGGMTVLPGLIDAHVHFVAAPGSSYRGDSAETVRRLNRQHLRAYLACGVTTVLDAGAFSDVARDIQSWLAAGHPGPRYLTTGPYFRPTDGYGHPRFGSEDTVAEVNEKFDQLEALGVVGIKIGLEKGIRFLGAPRPYPPEILDTIVRGAQQRGLPIFAHALTEETQKEAIRLDARALMHAPMDAMNPRDISDAFIEEAKRSGIFQLTTLSAADTLPAVYDIRRLDDPMLKLVVPPVELATARAPDAPAHFGVATIGWVAPWTPQWSRHWLAERLITRDRVLAVLDSAKRNLRRLHEAGVPIVAATDAPSPWPDAIYHFHGPQMAREIELLGEAGLSPLEAIVAATRNPAQMLGMEKEIGTLEVGKRADILLVEGDASTDLRALREVRFTIRDGVARSPEQWMLVGGASGPALDVRSSDTAGS